MIIILVSQHIILIHLTSCILDTHIVELYTALEKYYIYTYKICIKI
jgi:hypothetical protein